MGSWASLIWLGFGLAAGCDRLSPDVIESAVKPSYPSLYNVRLRNFLVLIGFKCI